MPRIRWEPSGEVVEAEAGGTLLDAALAQGMLLPFGCQSAKCGVCRVRVLSPEYEGLEESSRLEAGVLAAFRSEPGTRLACQARLRGDVVIRSLDAGASA